MRTATNHLGRWDSDSLYFQPHNSLQGSFFSGKLEGAGAVGISSWLQYRLAPFQLAQDHQDYSNC